MQEIEEDEKSQKSESTITKESIKSEEPEEAPVVVKETKKRVELHEICDVENLVQLKIKFDEALYNQMGPDALRENLRDVIGIEFDDEEFNIIFLKINSNRNGVVNWDEFVSYLLLCYAAKESVEMKYEAGGLVPPISNKISILRSQHPHAINCICFSANIDKQSWGNPIQGSYITLSPEGVINQWSLDMELIRSTMADCTVKRESKERTTLLTATCMPDVNILAVATSQNELYFYDTTAGGMTARVIIVKCGGSLVPLENPESCLLVVGDKGGHVFVMMFSSRSLGPFQKRTGKSLTKITFKNLLKGKLKDMTVRVFYNVHSAPVKQVSYYASLSSVISCSDCPTPLSMYSLTSASTCNVFAVPKGAVCFTFDEEMHSLATGSSDGAVLLWSIFVPLRASASFRGHHAPILIVVFQSKSKKLYSLDARRTIRVWSTRDYSCLQTYNEIPSTIGEHTFISAVYNPATRDLILASLQIAIIKCEPKLNELHTDGFTHSGSVSVVLYNALFKTVVTCGNDSIIICWDIITGVRQTTIYNAHTRVLNGETIMVQITAATFDPDYQLLVTGARDGSLKTWNFNTGSCLKNMSIEYMNEVTYILWISNRILAIGWNRHITEFDDSSMQAGATGKKWETRHTEDVSGGALRTTEVLGTISFAGELILWKLDTGRPVRQYLCQNPTERIKIQYTKRTKKLGSLSRSQDIIKVKRPQNEPPEMPQMVQYIAAHAIIFLSTRTINAETANFLVALGDGMVQVWSEHPAGGYLMSFCAVHIEGDYVTRFATDVDNKYLFSGTAAGYIKIWLMQNYVISKQVHVCMPELRLQFPFLWQDRVEGRAKRSCRKQPLPLLCSSYRAHLRSISALVYIPEHNYVLSGSADSSVRIWSLQGQYLGTLGTFLPWTLAPRKPPDVRKVASSTTLKVWNGGEVSRYVPIRGRNKLEITSSEFKLLKTLDEKLPSDYLLKRICRLPVHPPSIKTITLDDSLAHIPIYTHLQTALGTALPPRAKSPPGVRAVRQRREVRGPRKQLHFLKIVSEIPRSGFSFHRDNEEK